jgi:hypothetical protein
MMKDINLLDELNLAEQHPATESGVLHAVNQLFKIEAEQEQEILNAIHGISGIAASAEASWFDEKSIYSINAIEQVAVKFRLRFLESHYFKGEIPYEALMRVKEIQKKHNIELKNFFILAPAQHFKLGDCNDDPLLFIPLADGNFHLVHQWGNDMSWYKKHLYFPLRNFAALAISLVVLSAVLSLLMPTAALSANESATFFNAGRLVFFLWINLLMAAGLSYFWFAFNFSFSKDNWRSNFFNY